MSIDLITDLPVTSTDHDCICHIACHSSKLSRMVAVPGSIDAKAKAKVFIKERNILPHYEMPSEIIRKRDRHWNCAISKDMFKLSGIHSNHSLTFSK